MTRDEADVALGKVVFNDANHEVRVIVKEDGLHAYVLKVENGETQLPRGFILGSNALWYKKRESK